VLAHPELESLTIAHIDCDAFYASIEKRDNPQLHDKPVIVGGRKRGVVLTACYVARKRGVKSAMPMFRALKLCPDAIVIRPRMQVYVAVAREVRSMMRELTPVVESVSLDEAYLDLAGTERLHALSPAKVLARLARDIENRIGITVSVGLSCNKFLAKLASDLMKPRGFQVIGKEEAKDFLRDKPISMLRGAGQVLQSRLARDGFTKIGQLQDTDRRTLKARYGTTGVWLSELANAEAGRPVDPRGDRKTISSETTFERDLASFEELQRILFRQCEHVSSRAKKTRLGGRTIVLKLKTSGFRIRTRRISLMNPTQLADRMFRAA
jgi:DNA polymerase-4